MFKKNKTKAQAILEYIIVLSALVLGFLWARTTVFNNAKDNLNDVAQQADDVVSAVSFVN